MKTEPWSEPIPVEIAVKGDPLIKEAMDKIASGELQPGCGPLDIEWTEEDKERLNKALAKMFGWKDPVKPMDPETRRLAEAAVEAQKKDKRTMEEKINDGVKFICDTRVGGD